MSHLMTIYNIVEMLKEMYYNDKQIGGCYYVENL